MGRKFRIIILASLMTVASFGCKWNKEKVEVASTKDREVISPSDVTEDPQIAATVQQADLLAAGYDYDGAIQAVQSYPGYESVDKLTNAIAEYETQKANCVPIDVKEIPHVFYHSLIVDTQKAFDGDSQEAGYNQVMTTVDEFNKITQQMYDRGYVLVRLRDMVNQTTDEDGTVHFTEGEILLPPDKKAYVLSIDDVSYYHYMTQDGFPSRLIVDENGLPKNEYINEDGTTSVGDYDVVPLMDTFLREHPDAAYKGAKGIIALTGYNGVLGYRTDKAYQTRENLDKIQQEFLEQNPDFDYEKECQDARAVAQCLREDGWEFASHTWGHRDYGEISDELFYSDADKWQERVAPIVGTTDIIIFPFGADIGDWHPYQGERYEYLKSQGFNFFCNVDSSKSWVQIGDNYVRQGRRNLDGYRMYYDLIGETDKLSDLFDVSQVFSLERPTPVQRME